MAMRSKLQVGDSHYGGGVRTTRWPTFSLRRFPPPELVLTLRDHNYQGVQEQRRERGRVHSTRLIVVRTLVSRVFKSERG